jgi:hypothetical protein
LHVLSKVMIFVVYNARETSEGYKIKLIYLVQQGIR